MTRAERERRYRLGWIDGVMGGAAPVGSPHFQPKPGVCRFYDAGLAAGLEARRKRDLDAAMVCAVPKGEPEPDGGVGWTDGA